MKIIDRNLGAVMVMEFIGDSSGKDESRVQERTEIFLKSNPACRFGIFNLLETLELNPVLLKAVVAQASRFEKAAILGKFSNEESFEIIRPRNVALLSDLPQGIQCFEKELSDVGIQTEAEAKEVRRYERLCISLPVELSYNDDQGKQHLYHMFTVNLSEGGLLARFLDLQSAWSFFHHVDEYDLSLMKLRILLPGNQALTMGAKVVGRNDHEAHVRMEFYENFEEQGLVKDVIKNYRAEKNYAS